MPAVHHWKDAEICAASWMVSQGDGSARITQGGSDNGIDVASKSSLAQVKYEARPVGRPAIQRLVGAGGRSGKHLVFFSFNGYSPQAVQYANDEDVALFSFDQNFRVGKENASASTWLSDQHKDEQRALLREELPENTPPWLTEEILKIPVLPGLIIMGWREILHRFGMGCTILGVLLFGAFIVHSFLALIGRGADSFGWTDAAGFSLSGLSLIVAGRLLSRLNNVGVRDKNQEPLDITVQEAPPHDPGLAETSEFEAQPQTPAQQNPAPGTRVRFHGLRLSVGIVCVLLVYPFFFFGLIELVRALFGNPSDNWHRSLPLLCLAAAVGCVALASVLMPGGNEDSETSSP